MVSIAYDDVGKELVKAVPELRAAYESECASWAPEPPAWHVVYGSVLNPYLVSLLDQEGHDDELRRVFGLLERLATDGDVHVQEVVQVTVCEYLGADSARLAKARRYMGENTLRLSDEIERFWGSGSYR